MNNVPIVKLGIIATSRDCFPISLSARRRSAIVENCARRGLEIYESKITVENETDAMLALEDVVAADCNALVVFLGNFGPETSETIIAKYFNGPVMYIAAAEESEADLIHGRGDAYCGLLNCSYNLGLRKIDVVIPDYPVGTADELAAKIEEFIPVARAIIGLMNLKVITFGPRPQEFFACNAPIKGLYNLGIEIQENSELDLLVSYRAHSGDPRIPDVVADMRKELPACGCQTPELLEHMAQFEITLLDWAKNNLGSRRYVAFANKCWPAFLSEFGFEPCYVNSRLASQGIPVACEVDIYGAISEYIGTCLTLDAVTILDINNSVPSDLYEKKIKGIYEYTQTDTFMGFHCGNTPICKLNNGTLKYQLIQNRLLENGGEPNFTRGTMEGDIKPGNITLFRLQCNDDTTLQAYIAQGEVLPVATNSFGSIGVIAVKEMGRFYRNVLLEKRYPHHSAVAFAHCGKALFTVLKYLNVQNIEYNRPKHMLYPSENPFA